MRSRTKFGMTYEANVVPRVSHIRFYAVILGIRSGLVSSWALPLFAPVRTLPPQEAVSQCEKTNFLDRGRGGRVEKISSGNLYPFGIRRPKHMKTFDSPQETISHTLRHPHSKALEPDCFCPWLAIATQPSRGGWGRRSRQIELIHLIERA